MESGCRGAHLTSQHRIHSKDLMLPTLVPDAGCEEDGSCADPATPPPVSLANADGTPRLLEQTCVDKPVSDSALVVYLAVIEVRPLRGQLRTFERISLPS
jgi:hypothetical protein